MLQIFTIIAPLFLIIFASAILQKFFKIGDNWSTVLNDFALKIGLPALVFSTLAQTSFSFQTEAPVIIINSAFLLVGFILAITVGKILRLKKQMFLTLFICLAFSNIAYLGLPVLTQIYGTKILPTASLIIAIYLFWIFTLAISYLDYCTEKNKAVAIKNIFQNIIKNPLLMAVLFGIIISSLKITLPDILVQSLNMVSASVTPTVLVVIGLFIGKSQIGKLTEWIPILLFSVITLFALPAGLYFGLKLFGFLPTQFSTSIIEAAMPLAITPFALADKYNLDKKFIARAIVLSTLLSVVSLPFWISIL